MAVMSGPAAVTYLRENMEREASESMHALEQNTVKLTSGFQKASRLPQREKREQSRNYTVSLNHEGAPCMRSRSPLLGYMCASNDDIDYVIIVLH
mmetsp:Transcript_8520/g.17275  ORF Transcript_8520/g.17275 Transcript_8520/m.17275 type:complete len:95 (-) Transcript_8520:44-328(-)